MQPPGAIPRLRFCRSACWLVGSWVVLLGAVLAWPVASQSATLGDGLTRWTVRLSLAYYAVAALGMLGLSADDWRATTPRGAATRWLWTLSWATFLVHLGMAFHFYHGWSHEDAVAHTRAVSGVGEGIWLSHLFTLLWTLDVAAWWLRPAAYAARPAWQDRVLHGYMLFIIFNGMVVYEQGAIRWAGLALFVVLTAAWVRRRQLAAGPCGAALEPSAGG